MGRERLLGHLHANYVAARTVIVVAGKAKHRQVARAAARYVRRFRRGTRPASLPARTQQEAPRLRLFTKQTEQTQMALGIRTCSRHDERRFALRLLNTILGENMSSRLFQVVREDHGLAYSIYSTPSFFEDTGDLVISAGLDTENLLKTLRLIVRELRRLVQQPPQAGELRRARDYIFGQIDLGQESTDNQMNWIGEQLLGYGKIFSPNQIKQRLARVTAAEVRAVAASFFRGDRVNLALVSPLKSAKHVKALLSL
jgi:predicted Zn-dependent peptidase